MEAIKFLKEEIRFCREQEVCSNNCEVSCYCSFLNRPRNLTNDCVERRISIIEDWSKKHPIITNAEKFKEVFGLPAHCMIDQDAQWWDEPYKEP